MSNSCRTDRMIATVFAYFASDEDYKALLAGESIPAHKDPVIKEEQFVGVHMTENGLELETEPYGNDAFCVARIINRAHSGITTMDVLSAFKTGAMYLVKPSDDDLTTIPDIGVEDWILVQRDKESGKISLFRPSVFTS